MNWLTFALGLGLGGAAGWWARSQHQRHTPTWQELEIRVVYRHVDETTGATKRENQIRADKRFYLIHPRWHLAPWKNWRHLIPKRFREQLAGYFWPVPRRGEGTNPLPTDQRIRQYVWFTDKLVEGRTVRTWNIRYTSEAAANWPTFIEWLTRGRPGTGGGLAQALGREWSPNLFQVERDWSAGLVRLTLNHKTDVPDGPVTADAGMV